MKTYRFIHHQQLYSTNTFALEMLLENRAEEGLVVTTDVQTNGVGQRGKVWESECEKNLLMSVVLQPNITTTEQQVFNCAIALALYDVLVTYFGATVKIKWPNDIMIGTKKIAGILIQNKVLEAIITHAVVGIGMNVNQIRFNAYLPEATSFALECNTTFDVIAIRDKLLSRLKQRMNNLKSGNNIQEEYTDALYLKDKPATFQHAESKFMGIIRGITDEGSLILEQEYGDIYIYKNQEINYLF